MSITPILFCVWIMEFEYYCFGKSYGKNLYENELLKMYNSMLIKCSHLIVKLNLEYTTCIAILLGKILAKYKTWSQVECGKRDE